MFFGILTFGELKQHKKPIQLRILAPKDLKNCTRKQRPQIFISLLKIRWTEPVTRFQLATEPLKFSNNKTKNKNIQRVIPKDTHFYIWLGATTLSVSGVLPFCLYYLVLIGSVIMLTVLMLSAVKLSIAVLKLTICTLY